MEWVRYCIVFAGFLSMANGFKQELRLSNAQGEQILIDRNVADLSEYPNLSTVDYLCSQGVWDLYEGVNFTLPLKPVGSLQQQETCSRINMTGVKSVRHWAADDTDTDAISLYTNFFRRGNEILLTEPVATDINIPIGSIAVSGKTGWTVFKGRNLSGKSVCLKPKEESHLNYLNIVSGSSRKGCLTVGSLFKGCKKELIQRYKETNVLPKEDEY